jgi:hypothetical protein
MAYCRRLARTSRNHGATLSVDRLADARVAAEQECRPRVVDG